MVCSHDIKTMLNKGFSFSVVIYPAYVMCETLSFPGSQRLYMCECMCAQSFFASLYCVRKHIYFVWLKNQVEKKTKKTIKMIGYKN